MILRREQTINLTNAEIIEKVQKEIIESTALYTTIMIITPNVKYAKELWYKIAVEKFNLTDFRQRRIISTHDIEGVGICEQFGNTKAVIGIHNPKDITFDQLMLNDYIIRLRGEVKQHESDNRC